jgi:ESCRT-I complex subunit VPS28
MSRQTIGEIKAYENSKERNDLNMLADLYSIIKVTDLLEAAYSRDAISAVEYNDECSKLIAQFKATEKGLILNRTIENAVEFYRDYQVDCPRAYHRLIEAGVPATVMHPPADNRGDHVIVAETVQAFITLMDILKLNQRAVDEVQPYLEGLVTALGKVKGLTPNFEGLVKLKLWLTKLHNLRAYDEIAEDEVRQFLFDVDNAYAAFHKHLSG